MLSRVKVKNRTVPLKLENRLLLTELIYWHVGVTLAPRLHPLLLNIEDGWNCLLDIEDIDGLFRNNPQLSAPFNKEK